MISLYFKPRLVCRLAPCAAAVVAALALASCGTANNVSNRVAGIVSPYKIDVVQGNVVSKEQAAALKPGMNRLQVRDLLGTPLLVSMFHADRWDYVFTFKRQGAEPQARRVTVFFKDDLMERFDAGELPTEAEFVASLDSGRRIGKVQSLEASEETLAKFGAGKVPETAPGATAETVTGPATAATAAVPTSSARALPPLPERYPPLESPGR
jgi:outer membrane protein assembly factor BamE